MRMNNLGITLVLATGNLHKIEEMRAIIAPLLPDASVISLTEALEIAGISLYNDPEETSDTFVENARIKARAAYDVLKPYAQKKSWYIVADDSGLEVAALRGAPGVYSARYAGGHGDNAANRKKVLEDMADVPPEERGASFTCQLVCITPQGEEFDCRGVLEGEIAVKERGEHGFGYDPIFISSVYPDRTTAEITAEQKNEISHRGRACAKLASELSNLNS